MRVTSLRVEAFRSFASMEPIELGPVNILIGPNNAGKSSLIRALYLMQTGPVAPQREQRIGGDFFGVGPIAQVGFAVGDQPSTVAGVERRVGFLSGDLLTGAPPTRRDGCRLWLHLGSFGMRAALGAVLSASGAISEDQSGRRLPGTASPPFVVVSGKCLCACACTQRWRDRRQLLANESARS